MPTQPTTIDCSEPPAPAPAPVRTTYQYAVAYQTIGNNQIDVYGLFNSATEARAWADAQTWRYPQRVQVVTLQRPRQFDGRI